jgi:L-aminopeptidase/D-esterase-like protein
MHMVNKVHGIILSGGSAFGLDSASGVMNYLESKNIGFNTGVTRVPIVPAAILFDLGIGDPKVRPDSSMGYKASQNASSDPPIEGNQGAGTGCTVGKILGPGKAMKSGIGTASLEIGRGVIVGAIIAVNAFGDVIDPNNGEIIAGARSVISRGIKRGQQGYFANSLGVMKTNIGRSSMGIMSRGNTVIGVVATNAKLDKNDANKVAQMAQNGVARTIKPAHTLLDGDAIFTMATGKRKADVSIVGAFAAEVVAQAIIRGVQAASSAGGFPGLSS